MSAPPTLGTDCWVITADKLVKCLRTAYALRREAQWRSARTPPKIFNRSIAERAARAAAAAQHLLPDFIRPGHTDRFPGRSAVAFLGKLVPTGIAGLEPEDGRREAGDCQILLSAAEPQPKERGCVRRTSRSGRERHKGSERNRDLWRFRRAAAGAPHTAALPKIVAARDDFHRY